MKTLRKRRFAQRLTLCHEEVEHGDDHRVPAEHVVPARLDTGQRHAEPAPDGQRPLDLSQGVAVGLQDERNVARCQPDCSD